MDEKGGPGDILISRSVGIWLNGRGVNLLDRSGGTLRVDEVRDPLIREPGAFWHDEVADQCNDGDTSHDNRSIWDRLV